VTPTTTRLVARHEVDVVEQYRERDQPQGQRNKKSDDHHHTDLRGANRPRPHLSEVTQSLASATRNARTAALHYASRVTGIPRDSSSRMIFVHFMPAEIDHHSSFGK